MNQYAMNWELTHVFFWLVTIQTQWCDQHIRVIQFVEKLPNEYQTTVCTEFKKPQLSRLAKAPTLYTRWSFQTEDATCIYIYIEIHYEITLLRKKSEVINHILIFTKPESYGQSLSFSSPTFLKLYMIYIWLPRNSSKQPGETVGPPGKVMNQRWDERYRWPDENCFPMIRLSPFFSLKASYVPGTCLFSILGVEYSKRRSFRVQS